MTEKPTPKPMRARTVGGFIKLLKFYNIPEHYLISDFIVLDEDFGGFSMHPYSENSSFKDIPFIEDQEEEIKMEKISKIDQYINWYSEMNPFADAWTINELRLCLAPFFKDQEPVTICHALISTEQVDSKCREFLSWCRTISSVSAGTEHSDGVAHGVELAQEKFKEIFELKES